MPRRSNTVTGKAFEYAMVRSAVDFLTEHGVSTRVEESPAYATTLSSFNALDAQDRRKNIAAAKAAIETIFPLEPNLQQAEADDPIVISVQADARGQAGDVRDVLLTKRASGWEIGISCKHNHEALKHPRVTTDADFGTTWIGDPCSQGFLDEIRNVMETVRAWQGSRWSDHADKHSEVYEPVLKAYISEIARLCEVDAEAPTKLVRYFFGTKDFYKAIARDNIAHGSAGITEMMAFNLEGTLGKSLGAIRPLHPVRKVSLPTRLIEIGMKPGSSTTLIMTFNDGWSIKMRLHSADSKVKTTGLKWDVQLEGVPSGLFDQEKAWIPELVDPTSSDAVEHFATDF